MGPGLQMIGRTGLSFTSSEGWLDFEPHESDLRGSRGVTVIGILMLYMALCNFWNTVRHALADLSCALTYQKLLTSEAAVLRGALALHATSWQELNSAYKVQFQAVE